MAQPCACPEGWRINPQDVRFTELESGSVSGQIPYHCSKPPAGASNAVCKRRLRDTGPEKWEPPRPAASPPLPASHNLEQAPAALTSPRRLRPRR